MRSTPVKGCNDYLPQEALLREYMQNSIISTYESHGFQRIMTPTLEDSENLDKSDGGENLNLIFKILKRGDKLATALQSLDTEQLTDLGLRYDLTLPLSRFYAHHRHQLLSPFKCIQVDKVYRAERPQKGRLRELVQCDIDIIGSSSPNCEVELIHVTAKALLELGLKNFKVKVNDRRILNDLLLHCGFCPEELSSVCISFDKLDKIGVEGVVEELFHKNSSSDAIHTLKELLGKLPLSLEEIQKYCSSSTYIPHLQHILTQTQQLADGLYEVVFDPSLVRGQGYYTGTVFEIESKDFHGSIAGGGRYDNLIGKFLGEEIPAVGFSIGFERIFCILMENKAPIPCLKPLIALLYENDFANATTIAETYRKNYRVALIETPKKLGKYIASLENQGFDGIFICGKSKEVEFFSAKNL